MSENEREQFLAGNGRLHHVARDILLRRIVARAGRNTHFIMQRKCNHLARGCQRDVGGSSLSPVHKPAAPLGGFIYPMPGALNDTGLPSTTHCMACFLRELWSNCDVLGHAPKLKESAAG